MANLSNINNILRTSSLGVGINCDAEFSLDIEKASANAILSLNSNGGSGAEYVLSSTTAGEFVINKRYVGDRLTISSGGNATFSGEITSGDDINSGGKVVVNNPSGDRKIQFLRTGGKTWSIEHDSASIYFYNVTDTKDVLLMKNAGRVHFLFGQSKK